jgi:CheY-like chemotaxis protein
MAGDEEKYLEGGCDGYIDKPISISSFLQTVERFTAEVEGTMAMPNLRAAQSMK